MARRSLSIIVALLVLAPASAFGQVLYDCAMYGVVSTSCCCPEDGGQEAEPASDPIAEGRCCTARVPDINAQSPVRASSEPMPDLSLATRAAPSVGADVPRPSSADPRPGRSRAPPGPTAPIYVQLCSFLI